MALETHYQESPTKSSLLWKFCKIWLDTMMQTVEAAIWLSCLTMKRKLECVSVCATLKFETGPL